MLKKAREKMIRMLSFLSNNKEMIYEILKNNAIRNKKQYSRKKVTIPK